LAALAAGGSFDPRFNSSIPGSQQLTVFPTFPSGGLLTNSTIRTNILQGQVGTLAQLYQTNNLIPANFSFFPNPLTLYSSELTNLSNSSYDGLQLEVRRRTLSGIQFQASYVYSKAFTDTSVERGLDAQLDNSNPRVERAFAPWDLRHSFKLN